MQLPYLVVYFNRARSVGMDMSTYPAFSRHAALVASRYAVRTVLEQEGLMKAA